MVVAVVVVAFASGSLFGYYTFGADAVVWLYLPVGVTLSALLLTPRRQWPWILAAVALTEIVVDVSQRWDPIPASGLALANAAEPLVGALLLRRFVTGEVELLRPRHVVAFLVCCVGLAPVVGSLIGATTFVLDDRGAWVESFVPFWAGDATAVLTVAGSVLAWRYRDRAPGVAVRWVIAVLATTSVTVIGFSSGHQPLFYLPIPLLFWIGFSQRLPVMFTSGLAMAVTANWMTSDGYGPWADLAKPSPLTTVTLQLFLVTAVLGAWLLAVGVAERDAARSATSTERAALQRLHAMQTLTAHLARAATSSAIAEAVVRDGINLLADHGVVGIVTADRTQMRTWTTVDGPIPIVQPHRRVPLDSGTPLAVALRGSARIVHQSLDEMWSELELTVTYGSPDVRSGLCVPVTDGDGPPLGVLAFGFAREHVVDAETIAFAETLAGLTGQALRRAQSYERELDAAHQLQQALLPVLARRHSGIQVAADYRPADRAHDVGGDWYDVFDLPDGRVAFAVGDVVGHHLAAAAAMARLQSALRIVAQSAGGPAQVLEELDRASAFISNAEMATVGYADYEPATRLLRYACAGHLPPLLLTDDGAEYLWKARSMPVGVDPSDRAQAERTVPAGATLIWYTDGLVERRGVPLRAALDRLAAAAVHLNEQAPEQVCRSLLSQMTEGGPMLDDTVVLCIRFPAGDAAPSAVKRAGELVMEASFDVASLSATRHALRTAVDARGVPAARAYGFVLAVNEGLNNAIRHGGGGGRVTVECTQRRLVAVVEDQQPTRPLTLPTAPPPPTAVAGRGLWLISQLCDAVRFEAGTTGLRLMMELALDPP